MVPNTLEFPIIDGETKGMVTIGPIVRHAEDLMPVLRTLAGPDQIDPLAGDAQARLRHPCTASAGAARRRLTSGNGCSRPLI